MNFFATTIVRSTGALTQSARFAATSARVSKQPGFLRAVDRAPAATAQTTARRTAQTTARRGFTMPSTLKPVMTPEQLIAMRMFAKPGQCC